MKQTAIEDVVRGRIVGGDYAPGAQLPRRADLEAEFGASRGTIQAVFDRLLGDGFITTNGRGGTSVVPRPPHLHRIGLVFPSLPGANRFWNALDHEARVLTRAAARELVVYAGVDARRDSAAYRELLADARARRLAGIVIVANPEMLAADEILATGIPRVAIMRGSLPGIPGIYPDHESFVERAVAALAAEGRRRIAALVVDEFPVAALLQALARHAPATPPYLVQSVHLGGGGPTWARPLTRLLFQPGQQHPPDALIVADDNLVEHALGGLVEAGMRVPHDVAVVAHCNFPWPAPSVLPVRRLGFDARHVLDTCLRHLDRIRAGQPVPPETRIAACFEDEAADADRLATA